MDELSFSSCFKIIGIGPSEVRSVVISDLFLLWIDDEDDEEEEEEVVELEVVDATCSGG